jgi:lipoprotein signal peptidase
MNMGIGNLRTGIFNIADAVIMAGMFILLGRAIGWPPEKKSAEPQLSSAQNSQ